MAADGDVLVRSANDESTRLLCVGAQIDRDFCRDAINEFLSQPLRARAPTVGVNATHVLQECVAAYHRRRTRDIALAVLATLFTLLSPGMFLLWAGVALVWKLLGPRRRRLDDHRSHLPFTRSQLGYLLVAMLAITIIRQLLPAIFASPQSTGGPDGFEQLEASDPSGLSGFLLNTLFGSTPILLFNTALSIGMAAILIYDRRRVFDLLTGRLRRGHFSPTPKPGASTGWNPDLSRFSGNPVNCIVYRGPTPFIGSGVPESPWSLAVALEADTGGEAVVSSQPMSIKDLHSSVARTMLDLAHSSVGLAPSERLKQLHVEGTLYVPARSLNDTIRSPLLDELTATPGNPPRSEVPQYLLEAAAERPEEAVRFFAGYIVEAWDRELVVTLLVHFGLDEKNLYIDVVPCVLLPVRKDFHANDRPSDLSVSSAILDGLGSWTALPLTLAPRVSDLFKRPYVPDRKNAKDGVDGAAFSLRDFAAATDFQDYLQYSDATRYLKVLQSRLVRAIGIYLENNHYSAVEFMRQTAGMTFANYGTIVGSNIGGSSNVAVNLRAAEPRQPSGTEANPSSAQPAAAPQASTS